MNCCACNSREARRRKKQGSKNKDLFELQIIFGVAIIARLCPQMRPSLRLCFSKKAWSYLINFGSRLQVSSLSDIFKTQAPKLLAGVFFGPAAAGVYDLGNRLANAGWVLPVAFLPVIVPTCQWLKILDCLLKLISKQRLIHILFVLPAITAARTSAIKRPGPPLFPRIDHSPIVAR